MQHVIYESKASQSCSLEILSQEYGNSHDSIIRMYKNVPHGILNEIDNDMRKPETDRRIPKNYSITATVGKAERRRAMPAEFGREEDGHPVPAYIELLAMHSASEQNRKKTGGKFLDIKYD